ncbi:hypothetical protein P170DRAFT_313886, partial [Aspergillus steynii IBT 23096]
KRRATRACCHCRGRKVRCDVMEYGSPCTNCRLDKVDCMTLERRRKRLVLVPKTFASARMKSRNARRLVRRDGPAPLFVRCPHNLSMGCVANPVPVRAPTKPMSIESAQEEETSPLLTRGDESGFILPQYTRALPEHLDQDDIRFLAKKGALSVPATCLRNKLLTSYAHHVHSDMPLLDLDELVRPIITNDVDHPISLLLLQAVLFAAAAFVDIEDLQDVGFESRKHARATFYRRARLLYEFDYEQDRINLVQALLLMSYWEESPNGLKDGWHWLGLVLSVAQTIGLHRKTESADGDSMRIRTRLWWCIYTRDSVMALDMRHPMHISSIEFDTQPLMIDHFQLELSEPTVNSIGYSGLLGNAEHQRSLAVIFIAKVTLCHSVKHVLESQYSVEFDTSARVVPRRFIQEENQVSKCAQGLNRWVSSLAPEARYAFMDIASLTKAEGILHVQRSSLQMIYLSLMGALYRPHIHSESTNPDVREQPVPQLFFAARKTTSIAQNLQSLDLTKFLPATAVTALYSAGITQLLGVQDIHSQGVYIQHLRQDLYFLEGLQDIYPTAGSAASFLEAIIAR